MKSIIPLIFFVLTLHLPVFAAPELRVVKESEVHKVLVDYLKNRTANLDVELNIKKIGYNGDMRLPPGTVSYEVVAPRQWEGWGNANLALIIRVNDRVERNLTVRVEVEALVNMLVPVRPLERGEVIGKDDVAVRKMDLATVTGRICRTPEEALGMRVKMGIRANTPLRSDYLEKVPLVKSGQLVTIVVENEVMRLTATGQTKNAGAEGDMILVRNIASQKEISARVIDAKTVKVEF